MSHNTGLSLEVAELDYDYQAGFYFPEMRVRLKKQHICSSFINALKRKNDYFCSPELLVPAMMLMLMTVPQWTLNDNEAICQEGTEMNEVDHVPIILSVLACRRYNAYAHSLSLS